MNATQERPELLNGRLFLTPEESARSEVREAARKLLPILQEKHEKLYAEKLDLRMKVEQLETALCQMIDQCDRAEAEVNAARLLCES